MDDLELVASLAVALGVGLLIGLQREQQAVEENEDRALSLGGIRTFPLFALAGSVSMLLGRQMGTWVVGLGFAALTVPLVIAYADDVSKGRNRGLTTKSAFVLTFLLGVLAVSEGLIVPAKSRLLLVAGVGVAVTAMLSMKRPLHELVTRVSTEDIYATVKFLVLAVVVLPLLPDRGYGPEELQVLNPRHIGLMVTVIAGISFLGYVAYRVWGAGHGLGITGALGGLVSSTAVTLSLSERSRQEPAVAVACARGVVLASAVMFLRVVVMVGVVFPELVPAVIAPMGCAAVIGLLAAGALRGTGGATASNPSEVKLKNPFELKSAFTFGLLFAAILFVSKLALLRWGDKGVLLAGALAGSTSMDAATLSLARLAEHGLSYRTAAVGLLVASAAAMLVKAVIAAFLGEAGFRKRVVAAFAAMVAAGAGGLFLPWPA